MDDRKLTISELVGKNYNDFWNFKGTYRCCAGGRASKKSTTTALWYISNMMKEENSEANLLVVRAYYEDHKNTTYNELIKAIDKLDCSIDWDVRLSPLSLTFLPTGQVVLFKGLYDEASVKSITVQKGCLCWVWVEEADQIQEQSKFETLDKSIRTSIYDKMSKQITITCNTNLNNYHGKGEFWVKKIFYDNPKVNPLNVMAKITCHLDNEFLSEQTLQEYREMELENPELYKIDGLGGWGTSKNLNCLVNWCSTYFDINKLISDDREYTRSLFPAIYRNEELTEIKNKKFDNLDENCQLERYKRNLYISEERYRQLILKAGLDHGGTDPFAYVNCLVDNYMGIIYIFNEFESQIHSIELLAKSVNELMNPYRGLQVTADSNNVMINDELRRLGINIKKAYKGKDSVMGGITKINKFRTVIHPSCTHTIKCFNNYIWKVDTNGEPTNKPEHTYSHLVDAYRYAIEDIRPNTSGILDRAM